MQYKLQINNKATINLSNNYFENITEIYHQYGNYISKMSYHC